MHIATALKHPTVLIFPHSQARWLALIEGRAQAAPVIARFCGRLEGAGAATVQFTQLGYPANQWPRL